MATTISLVSCYILTHNSERYLEPILQMLSPVVYDIVLVDSGSTDSTRSIAERYGARFILRPLDSFRAQRAFALEQCMHNWCLSLDSDEVPSELFMDSLKQLMGRLELDQGTEAYRIERRWYMFGQEVRAFYPISSPDYPVRLFRKDLVGFNNSSNLVHEDPHGYTKAGLISGTVQHYSCDSVHELYQKLNQYTSLAAQDMERKGKKATRFKLIFSPVAAWIKWYLKKGSWRDGEVGRLLGRYAYDYTHQKYLKLRFNQNRSLYSNKKIDDVVQEKQDAGAAAIENRKAR
jgi:glycosyltransferase involved in cell wall biosynthesis